jgi:hypothetical protein
MDATDVIAGGVSSGILGLLLGHGASYLRARASEKRNEREKRQIDAWQEYLAVGELGKTAKTPAAVDSEALLREPAREAKPTNEALGIPEWGTPPEEKKPAVLDPLGQQLIRAERIAAELEEKAAALVSRTSPVATHELKRVRRIQGDVRAEIERLEKMVLSDPPYKVSDRRSAAAAAEAARKRAWDMDRADLERKLRSKKAGPLVVLGETVDVVSHDGTFQRSIATGAFDAQQIEAYTERAEYGMTSLPRYTIETYAVKFTQTNSNDVSIINEKVVRDRVLLQIRAQVPPECSILEETLQRTSLGVDEQGRPCWGYSVKVRRPR